MMNESHSRLVKSLFFVLCCVHCGSCSTWAEWWTYEGISGPTFWGVVNPEWSLCAKGRRQSPVNIEPRQLVFDPNLKHISVDKQSVSGTFTNTGRDLTFLIDDVSSTHALNLTGGPLSYRYRIVHVKLHFGGNDSLGSEHTIDGQAYPLEIQIVCYNSDLYTNHSVAVRSPNGLTIMAILGQVTKRSTKIVKLPQVDNPNYDLALLVQHLKYVKYKGDKVRVRHLSVRGMMPESAEYVTYEGSLTQPGCDETVTWVILNKPIYITEKHLSILRNTFRGTKSSPMTQMADNFRPVAPLNHRMLRTNINIPNPTKDCTMESPLKYQANTWSRE